MIEKLTNTGNEEETEPTTELAPIDSV